MCFILLADNIKDTASSSRYLQMAPTSIENPKTNDDATATNIIGTLVFVFIIRIISDLQSNTGLI